MDKKESFKEREYNRRIDLCVIAISRAAESVGLSAYITLEYQGCEVLVKNETNADARVIILMGTGYGPRFPKYIALTVHGYIHKKITGKLFISGGKIGIVGGKFSPNEISEKWLTESISDVAKKLRKLCTKKSMEIIEKEARKKRRQEIKENGSALYQNTYFDIKDKK